MTLRSGHGKGSGVPGVEVLPPDEQPFAPAGAAVPSGGAGPRRACPNRRSGAGDGAATAPGRVHSPEARL